MPGKRRTYLLRASRGKTLNCCSYLLTASISLGLASGEEVDADEICAVDAHNRQGIACSAESAKDSSR